MFLTVFTDHEVFQSVTTVPSCEETSSAAFCYVNDPRDLGINELISPEIYSKSQYGSLTDC